MLVWSSHFPVVPSGSTNKLYEVFLHWIDGSPHYKIDIGKVPKPLLGETQWLKTNNEAVGVSSIVADKHDMIGLRYEKIDEAFRWTTDVCGQHRGQQFIVGVTLRRETLGVGIRPVNPKKPIIARQILDHLKGDLDGSFQVSTTSHKLTNQQVDEAALIVDGRSSHYLPIVYVSAGFTGDPAVDVDRLASRVRTER